MAGITGLGSGIDIDTLVSTLVTAEQAPKKAALDRLETATTTKVSALGQLRGALSTFQTAITALNSPTLFEKRAATSSDTSLATATTTSAAQAGSYALKVTQLAASSQTVTASVNAGTTFSAGTLTVHLGASDTGTLVNVADGATLEDIRDTLNESLADTGITASLITNPGDGKTRLVMTSTETGEGKDVYITATGGVSALAIGDVLDPDNLSAATDSTAGFLREAQDAEFSINGLSMSNTTNTISTAIDGVTFNLVGADASKTTNISVSQDKSGVTANIKKFVDAYNALITTTNSLTAVVSVGEGEKPVTGGLVGDASVRNLLSGIRRELSSSASEDSIKMLTDLGITTNKDGTLSTDSTALSDALDENFDAVGAFFTGDTGLMSRLDERIGAYADTGGILESRVSALQKTLNNVDDQRDALALRMEKVQTRLYAQFNAMDTLVAQLTSTSDWMTSAFENLPGSSSSN